MNEMKQLAQQLPIELRAHLYQKLEEIRKYLVPGLEVDVKINQQAAEGFSIEYILKAQGLEIKSDAKGKDAFAVTNEATEAMLHQLGNMRVQIQEFLEANNIILERPETLH
tara:strand:+ start:8251 stop:8583 length:333 start_codon:yes stop_codon:yes gene_type:complete